MKNFDSHLLEPRQNDDFVLKETLEAALHDEFMTAIDRHYGCYIQKAYGYLRCKSLAEDAVQDGILAAYKHLHKVRDVSALKSWINKIIANKALDILRKNKRTPVYYADIEDILSHHSSGLLNKPLWSETSTPEQDIMKKERLQKLTQSIDDLQDMYRIPLLLKDYQGFSIKEISKFLGISESNSKIRVHRARVKVKTDLGEYSSPYQNRCNRN